MNNILQKYLKLQLHQILDIDQLKSHESKDIVRYVLTDTRIFDSRIELGSKIYLFIFYK